MSASARERLAGLGVSADANDAAEPSGGAPDWRVWMGLSLTALWLLLGFYYIFEIVGFGKFIYGGPPAVGGFLEGAFAPLAFLWLVIGFFLQSKELSKATQQAARQAESIAAQALSSRQDSYLKLADLVMAQLGGILGMLFMSSHGPAGDTTITNEEIGEMWERLGGGDPQVFGRQMMAANFRSDDPEKSWALFWGTAIRTRHSRNFMQNFTEMIEQGREADPNGMLRRALRGSAHGQVYDLMDRYLRAREPVE